MERSALATSHNGPTRAYVDAHVHIHKCFDLDRFLIAAVRNFREQALTCPDGTRPRYVLCLTESSGVDYFCRLSAETNKNEPSIGRWSFHSSNSDVSLLASHPDLGLLELVAGRQIVTAERLEILALGTTRTWDDGHATFDVINSVVDAHAIPVLPWGFGKWLGARRRIVVSLIERFSDELLCLGDNGGRPNIMPDPPEFIQAARLGMKILPGSDPLPFASEFARAGSFGFYVDCARNGDGVWPSVRQLLRQNKADIGRFGSLESPIRFFRNQLTMQYVMRTSRRRKAC